MNHITTHLSRWAAVAVIGTAIAAPAAWAQPSAEAVAPAQQASQPEHRPGHPHQRHKAEHSAQRLERMKNLLQLQPEQQAAWDTYVASVHQHSKKMEQAHKADWKNMNTLQRLDAKAQMRKEHLATAEQRDQATRAFYNSLNSTQQKAFDSLPMGGKHRGHF